MKRNGGPVFPASANPGDPNGPFEAWQVMKNARGLISDGPAHNNLRSEAGYIDARSQTDRSIKNLLRRTAGP